MALRRIVLVRHGETDGESSVRYHGRSDVALSAEGEEQMRRAAVRLGSEPEEVVASPLARSWRSAWIAGRGRPVRIERDFREIDFGRWEGLTAEEIRAVDPVRYEQWQAGEKDFEYPGGEGQAAFRERIARGVARLEASYATSVLAVLHKGVIREIVRLLTGEPPPRPHPELGESIVLTRSPEGWFRGVHSSDPPALRELED